MNQEHLKYQKNRLLRTIFAILLLFAVSFSHTHSNTLRQTFQSETLYSKKNNSGRKIVSYKKAVRLGVLNAKSETSSIGTDFSTIHTAQAKVKTIQKHKEYYSFKSNIQFFRAMKISDLVEETPIS